MASRYWVGGTASWNGTAGTKWATTSGGTGGAAEPTSSDDVFFDANSGAVTVTLDTTVAICNNLNTTGFTGTLALTLTNSLYIYGNLTVGSSTTFSGSALNIISFLSTSTGKTVTSNGVTTLPTLTFNGSGGGWTLQDNLTIRGTLRVQTGTFDANNKDITAIAYQINGALTRTVTMGSGTWSASGAGSIWIADTVTGLTFNPNTSTIKFTNSTANGKSFLGGGLTYNNLWFSGFGTGTYTVYGSNTFNDFKDDVSAGHGIDFSSGTTTTVTTWTVSGTAGNTISLDSTSTGVWYLVKSGGGVVSSNYLVIQYSVASPSSTWYAGAASTDNQGTTGGSGWIFTSPPGSNHGFFF